MQDEKLRMARAGAHSASTRPRFFILHKGAMIGKRRMARQSHPTLIMDPGRSALAQVFTFEKNERDQSLSQEPTT